MGRCKSLATWHHFFDMHFSSGARNLCFYILSSLRTHQLTFGGGCSRWWPWHPLSTDKAGNIPFLTWMYPFCSSINLILSHCIFKKKITELILPSLCYTTKFYSSLNLSISMETYYFFCAEKLKQSPHDPPFSLFIYYISPIFFIEKLLKRSPLCVVSNSLLAYFQ